MILTSEKSSLRSDSSLRKREREERVESARLSSPKADGLAHKVQRVEVSADDPSYVRSVTSAIPARGENDDQLEVSDPRERR